ncbi:MAG: OmpA family protein [Planctomycetota bacterium]|nr:OmpA family protein [Planctomycetota bacterium]
MNRIFQSAATRILAITLAAGTLTGCVGQGEYDNLYTTNRSLKARNAELERERDEARTALEALKKSLGSGEGALAALQKENSELRRLLDEANASLKDLESKMAGLDFGKLDADTDALLKKFAAMYPDLVKYDAERGMLRFASDLTFDSGSIVVKEDAKRALSALAEVLKASSAMQYEVVVEGHTDSQRISSGTAKNHPTNRHLSAHRAIAVIDVLGSGGVTWGRMMAAGWGEFRPVVANNSSGNTPANRRVEIYLAKSHGTGTAGNAAAPATTTDSTAVAPDRREPPKKPIDLTK